MLKKVYDTLINLLWSGLLVFMPVTSMPLVAALISPGTTVASPAGVFLLVLVMVWLIPLIFKGLTFSKQNLPLFVFVLYAVFTTLISFYYVTPPYKTESPLRSSLEAFITLMIGVCFYVVVSAWINNREKLEYSLRIINWSGLLLLIWAGVQAFAWYAWHQYPTWMRDFNELYSVGPLYRQRVSGFALEPSWFAHQLNMLYLPLWLALTVNRFSVHRFRIFKISFENILLLGGFAALFLSYSRVGLAAFLLMVAYVVLRINLSLINGLQKIISASRLDRVKKFSPRLLALVIGILLFGVYLGLLYGLAVGLSRVDPRMAGLFEFDINRPDAIMYYANQLTFASRLVYWQAGWELFDQFPWLGAGLGKAGFYLHTYLSPYAWRLMEVRDLVYRSGSALNIKSLWVRLLAESGIVGFSIFVAWLLNLWRGTYNINHVDDPLIKSMVWMGRFVIIGLLIEGFSVDTFALPYLWVSLGILTASIEWASIKKVKSETL